MSKYKVMTPEELKEQLTELEYEVTQNKGTEAPFSSPLDHEFRAGIYVDRTSGEPLFSSTHKFNSGCGWPAFSQPISQALLTESVDTSLSRVRTEVTATLSQAHLGHVFNDGPEELGGLRYCINGAALRFIPKEEMEAAGYGEYLPLVEEA